MPPLVITASCAYLAFVPNKRYLSYALINLAMVAATLAFGLLTEMRVWVDLSPPVVLATAVALASADAHSAHNRSAG